MPKNKTISIILGPTSTGKTSLAIDLCKKLDRSIISADSRQIYKHMDIGTGKLPIQTAKSPKIKKNDKNWIIDGVKIHGYDIATPGEYYSPTNYAKYAVTTIREEVSQNHDMLVVGGTGFYIDLITGRASTAGIKPDFKLRAKLEQESTSTLVKTLTSLNPQKVAEIDQNNPIRLIRAIEIEKASKKNPTPLPYLKDFDFKFIGLTASREVLYARADKWTENIWENGLIKETQSLLDMGFENTNPLKGLIYKDVVAYIRGDQKKDEAIQKCKYSLHAYIRRQQTWFKKNKLIKWYDITKSNLGDTIYIELKNL